MSLADQQHWDRRYSNVNSSPQPAQVLTDNHNLLPTHGQALDLACGLGGNALWLAKRGLSVEAWDCSPVALEKLQRTASEQNLSISTHVVDLDDKLLPVAAFDLIVVSGFLSRVLCPAIAAALRPGGLLAYQTYTQAQPATNLKGPSNPKFLLAPGELLELFSNLSPCVYREESNYGDLQRGLRNQAYLLAYIR